MFRQYFQNIPPVTKNLLIINLIIWVAINFLRHGDVVVEYGALYYMGSPLFKPYQLVTYMFIQQDFMHLFFNMFALFMFGRILEYSLGSKRFLFYYISCGIGAALIQMGVFALIIGDYELPQTVVTALQNGQTSAMLTPKESAELFTGVGHYFLVPTIGASGAVYGILLGFGMLFPNQPLYLMFIPVPIKAKWMVLGYGIIELLQGIGRFQGDNVAHFAHLGGMIIGLFIILYWKKKGIIRNDFY
ncbi:MAG: rhomboid family intramembrane serine protease [Muribaculaceae bacterium]|nr:rhomboid family intramembrane serine protease [Muribaculaceae bacterium]